MPVILRWLLNLGPTNPIAVRLVQNGSRRARHLYIRSAYLGILIVVLLWALLINGGGGVRSYTQLAAAGAASFTIIAYLQIGLICVLAPVFMAGAIAQESNPRTWEVLLTTPLTAAQIVLGNLFGRLFFVLALLAASLPLFALTQYFGGVPGTSILASYAVAACAALLVGALAIALSVSRMVGKRAVFTFYISVVSYLAITAGADRFLISLGRGAGPGGDGVTWFTAINPFLALYALLNPTSYPRALPGSTSGPAAWFLENPVTTWCAGSALLSAFVMAAATLTVRSGGLASLGGESTGTPWYRRIFGLGAPGAEHRPPRAVWNNPIAWREAAARNSTAARIWARWLFIGVGALYGLALIILYHVGYLSHTEFQLALSVSVWGMLMVTTLVAINMAATAVSREREDGTLDLLLTTPITPGAYLTGKLRGLIAYLLPMLAVPLGLIAITGIYVGAGGLERSDGVMVEHPLAAGATLAVPVLLPESALLAPLVVLPFIAFCCMVGLHWSLRSRGTIGSVVATFSVIMVVSGIVGLCGWQSAASIPSVGPFLGAFSPVSLMRALTDPVNAFGIGGPNSPSLGTARGSLALGAGVAAGVYAALVYGIHANMVRTFDMTVRKLAGAR